MRTILLFMTAPLLLVLFSCASGPVRDEPLATSFTLIPRECGIPGSFSATEELKAHYDRLILGGERNAVLNFSQLGLRAFRMGDFCTAAAAFDEAERHVAPMIAEDREAAKARGKFGREEAKFFKGEPYERSMLYLYRGLLFYMAGEYDNARACFRSGQLADAHAEGEEYRADYVSLNYLEALADSHYAGNNVEDLMKAAHETLPGERYVPPLDATRNVLIVVESGAAPVKYGAGPHQERLGFGPGMRRGGAVCVLKVDGKDVARAENPTEDVYYQASTRGGRELDHILAGQAQFKDAADTTGDVMIVGGAVVAAEGFDRDDRKLKGIGAALAVGGLIAKGLSAGTQPQADIRAWSNLPDRLHVFSIALEPGEHTIKAELLDRNGKLLADVEMKNFWIKEGDPERVALLAAIPKGEY
jgi:tetratricopeptide (TPR) repeat protein